MTKPANPLTSDLRGVWHPQAAYLTKMPLYQGVTLYPGCWKMLPAGTDGAWIGKSKSYAR